MRNIPVPSTWVRSLNACAAKVLRRTLRGMKIAPQRVFPAYIRPDLRTPTIGAHKKERQRVLFFPGCFIRYNRPELGHKVIDLLDRNGFTTEVAATDCCGVPALANGDRTKARSLAQDNVL